MKGKLKLILTALIFSLFIFSGFAYSGIGNNISSEVYINGINVGGMTRSQALTKLRETFEPNVRNNYILLKYDYKMWRLTYADIGTAYNYQRALDAAFAVPGSNNEVKTTTGSVDFQPPAEKHNITMGFAYDKRKITDFLKMLSNKINTDPINPSIRITGKKFTVTDGKDGIKLNTDKAFKLIASNIKPGKNAALALPTDPVKLKWEKNDLANIKDKLGEYRTRFNSSDVDRVNNIKLAAKGVINVIVMPNEIFSVNKAIGPRIEENGYKLAHVIVNNELVDGIGGGICQVSTTLYNAVLYSNLKIVERTNHSLPSAYVSLGRDATVSGNYKDFKFQNNTKYPIFVTGEIKGSYLHFAIYGKKEYPNRKVKIITKILSVVRPKIKIVEDPTLPKGKVVEERKGSSGYTVESAREVFENGKLLYTEPLFTDKYPLVNGIKRVGTGKTNQ